MLHTPDKTMALMRPSHTPLVKICGLTSPVDALAAAEAGADWIGLNFHPASPRQVTLERASEIVRALPATVVPVGVFVDRPPAEVAEVAERVGLRVVQLHGEEPPSTLAALGHLLQVVRAFRLADASSLDRMLAYLDDTDRLSRSPDAILIDAHVPGRPGGTGRTIDAELLDRLPRDRFERLILAGGLTPQNVGERVARYRPWMVDVAGGVESSPGRKDARLLAAFIRAAREGDVAPIPGNVR